MRALRFHGLGRKGWDQVPAPRLLAHLDAIVRVDAATLCGTDLHILRGDVPAVTPGRILGHEAVGTVTEIGDGVRTLKPGDRVLVSCITACGTCRFCREGRYGQCLGGGGWVLGHRIDGTHADFVRVPYAERSTCLVPPSVSDEAVLMLADLLPTAFEVGVRNGGVSPGDTVVVVGAGPVGLAALVTARLFSPSLVVAVDLSDARLDAAKQFGADIVVNNERSDPLDVVHEHTDGLGADVAIEAVGAPETFELCTRVIRPGGRVANIGIHGRSAVLHLERLWTSDVTITTGLVDTVTTPTLLRLVASGQLDAARFVTHRFAFDEFLAAYNAFERAEESGALKVVVSRT
ncbi:MAG TPA: alcohol dehydrogenase catalytic domain-containing protein [Mycobacteriales bacterium]|nr:alcohol dehydrogenase catalytic domain-containing protein [Mycobacteriales bacterium]